MYLLAVKAVRKYEMSEGLPAYVLDFGDCALAASALHAFKCSDETLKATPDLQGGDRIWVDLPAFLADGSFTRAWPKPARGMAIHHRDGDLANNDLSNLEQVPLKANRR